MRLGTVTRNIHRNDEIDIDLVARRDLEKASVTQAQLKDDVGTGLDLFIKAGPEGDPRKEEGKRCWTLQYPGFHVDVLPALPDAGSGGSAISITDTEVQRWLPSNPIGYAEWFHNVMRAERLALTEKAMAIAPVPEWTIKTTLQRTVQALKRHRDIYFTGHLDDRPASVIITTLAAQAYTGGESLYDVLREVSAAMPGFVEERNGVYVVSNPVQPKENFADRWRRHPRRADRFFEWVEHAAAEFAGLGETRGPDKVLEKVALALGERSAEHAERTAGFRTVREPPQWAAGHDPRHRDPSRGRRAAGAGPHLPRGVNCRALTARSSCRLSVSTRTSPMGPSGSGPPCSCGRPG